MVEESYRANITIMGIEPTYPSEKYGYIIPETNNAVSKVKGFKEKPIADTAKTHIEQGALWNAGVFAFKLSYLPGIIEKMFGTYSYDFLIEHYDSFPKISFDYTVVEKEKDINVLRFNGEWKDLGTWNTLTEAMIDPVSGNATVDYCENTHVVNELAIPLVALGIQNAVIAATPDGILVADKTFSQKLKEYVISQRPMYERRG